MVRASGRGELEILINMKESIKMTKNLAMEFSHGQLGMYIKVTMNATTEMGLEKCIGVIIVFIKEIGKMEFRMEMGKFISLGKDLEREFFRIINLLSCKNNHKSLKIRSILKGMTPL